MDSAMRRCGSVLLGLVLLAYSVRAQQVDVKLTLAYTTFVTGEPVLVQFEALNATRDMIRVGGPEAKDSLFVEITKGGQYNDVAPFDVAPIAAVFELKPGQSYQYKVELDKWFPLVEQGKYLARLVLVHDGMRYESSLKSFDVLPGIPVKEAVQMFVSRPNQKRLFRLVHWSRNQTDRLFIRFEDEPGGRIWDSVDLGVLLRTEPPKIDISPEGEVTVLHRSTQDSYIRTVIWSLPDSVEVVERNVLLDPEISASQRVRSLYGEMSDDGKKGKTKSWWKFW